MNKESILYLHSNLCQNVNNNILHEIFTTETKTSSMITYYNIIPEITAKKYTKHKNYAKFMLTDEDDVVIDLNGLNINFMIMFL